MITGFNTDVDFDGVTYHVQTEDKGLESALIVSLVYRAGTIIASKRLQYREMVNGDVDIKALSAKLRKQHRLMCAAIQTGRIEELIAMTRRDAAANGSTKGSKKGKSNGSKPNVELEDQPPIPIPPIEEVPIVAPDPGEEPLPVVDAVEVMHDSVVPPDAVHVVSQMAGKERPANNKLCLELVNEKRFKAGQRRTITLMVSRGTDRKVIDDAKVQLKIMGSNFRPQILHTVTDRNGLAKLEVELPKFSGGRAAVLVRASSNGEEVELRRPIAIT